MWDKEVSVKWVWDKGVGLIDVDATNVDVAKEEDKDKEGIEEEDNEGVEEEE